MIRQFLGGCWFGEAVGWFRNVSGAYGGHEWREDSCDRDCSVQVLRCEKCGEYSIGWWRNDARGIHR